MKNWCVVHSVQDVSVLVTGTLVDINKEGVKRVFKTQFYIEDFGLGNPSKELTTLVERESVSGDFTDADWELYATLPVTQKRVKDYLRYLKERG